MRERQSTLREVKLEPGWLEREAEAARWHMADWPQWKRDMARSWFEELGRPDPNPCRCPRACDTAQTCVGGCVYGR